MDEEKNLENTLKEYLANLASVDHALTLSQNDQELLELRKNLKEVVELTEQELLNLKKRNLLAALDSFQNEDENEMDKFQAEIASISGPKPKEESEEEEEGDQELHRYLSELEGSTCRVPHSQEWGELGYHNALVASVDANEAQTAEDVSVLVMFCNPTCQSMVPCPFFLDGRCKFSNELCNYSHGYEVKLSDLEEFKDPDYSLLQKDFMCLAKYTDNIWYKATILDCLDDNKLRILYSQYNEEATLGVEDVLPLDNQPVYSGSDLSEDEETTESRNNVESSEHHVDSAEDVLKVAWNTTTASPMGDWEKHTKGFGSKVMELMGYVKGQGLGRNGEGRVEPIEAATVFKQGMSLDKCMELREMKEGQDPELVKKRVKHKRNLHDQKVAEGYQLNHKQTKKKKSVFDFLNNKLSTKSDEASQIKKSGGNQELRKSSVKGLNVQSLQVGEDLNRATREMGRLKQALARNENKDRVVKGQLEGKIQVQDQLIQKLRLQEKAISREQSSRKDHQKLTIF